MINENVWNYNDLMSILKKIDTIKIIANDKEHILVEVCSYKAYMEMFPYYSVKWCFRGYSESISKGFYNSYVKQNERRKQYVIFDLSKPFTIFSRLDDSDLSCITFTTEIPNKKDVIPNLINGSQIIFAFSRSETNIAIPSSKLYGDFVKIVNELIKSTTEI